MSSQRVILPIPIADGWDAGDRLQVFTDWGDGTIDTSTPLLARPLNIFPGQQRAKPLGRQPVGRGRVGDHKASRPRRGLGRTRIGRTPVGTTPAVIHVPVDVPPAFATWKFAAQVVDVNGNVQSEDPAEISAVVSGTEPGPLASFALDSYDDGTDQATFAFAVDDE